MSNGFPMVPLACIVRDLTKERLVQIKPDDDVVNPTITSRTHSISIASIQEGISVRVRKRVRLKPGDLVFSRLHTQNGAFAFVDRSYLATTTFLPLVIDETQVDRRFLFWALHVRVPTLFASDTVGRETYKPQDILSLEIPLPTLSEQRRIATRIEGLAALIKEARGLRAKAREEAKALVSSALSQMFDYQTTDRLPSGWVWRPFGELLIDGKKGMRTGPFGTLLHKSEIQSQGVPVLGIANVQANRFVPGFTDYVSPEKAEQLSSYELQVGDIVVARSGTVGRSCVVSSRFDPAPIMSTNLIRLRLDTQVFLPELLSRLFNGSRLVERHKESECRGSTRSFFTQRILLKLQVPVPPLPEQRHIVAYLDGLQAQVNELTALQDGTQAELDALLPSVLDRAFRGEL